MKKIVSLLLACLMILSLVGCGNNKESGSGAILYTGMINSDIDNYDPFTSQTMQFMNTINFNCYECLMHLNGNMEYEMDLATSYEQPDDTTYIFHLREGVKFHNGEDFTADDVVYTINTIIDPSTGAWRAGQYENVDSVEAVDAHTVKIVLKDPQPAFLDNIAYTAIVSKSTKPADLVAHPVGTGAFKFVSWTPNDNVTLEKNSDYWDADKVNFDKWVIKMIADQTVALENLKSGAVQYLNQISTEVAKTIEDTDGLQVYKSAYANTVYEFEIGRHNKEALANPDVIKAMFLAFNKDSVVNDIYNGMVSAAKSPFPSSAKFYGEYDTEGYDINKAKEVLASTPFKNGFSFDILTSSSAGGEFETLVMWQADLKKIGIEMNVKTVDFSIWLDEYLGRTYDMICNSYSMVGTDPATYCGVLLSALKDYQTGDLPELNELIKNGAAITDETERASIYGEIQEILVKYRPVTSYIESPSLNGASQSLKGIVVNGMGHCFLKNAYVEK